MARAKAGEGHVAHSRPMEDKTGMDGTFHRPIKVTVLGAGSGFTPILANDLFSMPGSQGIELVLVDIDRKRLEVMHRVVRLVAEARGYSSSLVKASTDRRKVMGGSDYLICTMEVSGLECVRHDNDIPKKYGVDQCIGDTIGPGGLFKGLRTIPVFLEILKDAERLCPGAIVLNYTNPMNMMCLAAGRSSDIPVVGLCHSVQGTSHQLADRAKVPHAEMVWECAGINHLAWFTKLEHKGRSLYPKLIRQAKKDLENPVPGEAKEFWDRVRKDVMIHFGAFVTESSGHLSEYLPWYRKRRDLVKKYMVPRYGGESGFYARDWPKWRKQSDDWRRKALAGKVELPKQRSWEYASYIIEAREKNVTYKFHGNVMNDHRGAGPLIGNLLHDGCVEVACLVDQNGVHPTAYGNLPPHMAAVCRSNMSVFDLGAKAAIEKSVEAAIHALYLDPLTSAVCSLAEIRDMTLEMFKAQRKYLKGYR